MSEKDSNCEVKTSKQPSEKKLSLREKLVIWITNIIKHLPHSIIDELLKLLRSEGHYEIPKATETLLKTQRTNGIITEIMSKKGKFGEYVYMGIKSGLKTQIINSGLSENTIKVIVNIDSFPLWWGEDCSHPAR